MRLIGATFHRKMTPVSSRSYARIDTALPSIIKQLLLYGRPKDVAQVYGRETGVWICDISIHAGGKINIRWE